ncbi:MAG: nickel pincer cofactor biosynthesis protein LarC [Lachnospiraceae bacterium]|nr:nickel pincer cofactor biosynthesis protein LarC [Lachnospiraceae bacterium]
MKTLFIDCGMGAAGDMLTAALLDSLDEKAKEKLVSDIKNLGIEGVEFELTSAVKQGIAGSHVSVKVNGEEEGSHDVHNHSHDDVHDHDHHHHDDDHGHDHDHHHDDDDDHDHDHGHHHHYALSDVVAVIDSFNVSDKVKEKAKKVYITLAEAEGHVHGKEPSMVHFHEVGSKDAVVDITAVCMLLDYINPDKIIASPVHVGSGKVKCAHGIVPVPAPATAYLLKGIPIYGGKIMGELCTPTGAALLKTFVDEFGDMPVMSVDSIGYGMGNKDFEVANCVRVMVGETSDLKDKIVELNCNVDDMTGEQIGFAIERIMAAGARDVFVTPTVMKKSRPGHVFSVICTPDDRLKVVEAVMKYTSTLGVREKVCDRYILDRKMETVDTKFGPVNKKVSTGYGARKEKLEFEDLAKIARENNKSLTEIVNMINGD